MKELSLEWQLAAHALLIAVASARDTPAEISAKAKRLLKQAEAEYEAQS